MSVRRFIWRWSWRQVQNEWRQHVVILAMLALGVAAAIAGVLTAHNVAAPPSSEFGNGQIAVQTTDSDALSAALSANGIAFGTIHDAEFERDGQVGQIKLRAADPANPITQPLIAVVEGRWPTTINEVAITDRALADRLGIGDSFSIDSRTVEIVGVVESPVRLSEEFVFTTEQNGLGLVDDFEERFLVDATADQVHDAADGSLRLDIAEIGGLSDRAAVTLLVNVITAFGMLEVGLLVGSAFAVIARRRTRQYGLLASAGATPSMVRKTATSTGAIVGLIGTSAGFVLGVVISLGLIPAMEGSVDHRISFEFPLLALVPPVVMGVAVTTIAARRPATRLNKSSVASLLSSARPQPEPVGVSSMVGLVMAIGGTVLLIQGFLRLNSVMAILGTVLAPIGLLLFAPLLVKVLGLIAAKLALSERLGGRTIARYNRRSASLAAALALALAIPVGISTVSSSIDQRAASEPPNLGENQLIVWAPDIELWRSTIPAATDEEALEDAMESLAEAAPELTFVPLQVFIPRPEESFREDGVRRVSPLIQGELSVGECSFCSSDTIAFDDDREYLAGLAFAGTPELLAALELDSDWVAEGKVAVARDEALTLLAYEGPADSGSIAVSSLWPNIGSFPGLVYSPEEANGAPLTTIGWLATSTGALTDETITSIADANLGPVELELPTPTEPRSTLRLGGLAIGSLVGMAIAAAAVVLLNTEIARESAVLASLGARPRTGRRMSASIAGFLALTGVALAVAIGFIPLAPMVSAKVDPFPFVIPWSTLFALGVAFPVCAAILGRLLSKTSSEGRNLRDFA